MRAVCWYGKGDVRVETVPDPSILNPRDAIVRVTLTAICGSDLHIYNGHIPGMERGDILGHEFMGEVVEVGAQVRNLKRGDRVVVPFTICCGKCYFCQSQQWSLCDNTNPNAPALHKLYGASGAGLFGYSHLYGGYAGGQSQFVRVPFAGVAPIVVDNDLTDEQVLFLSDILPTGFMAADNCNIHAGDVVAVWGCGPVGQFAIRSAYLLGAEKVIAIDDVPERLRLARERSGAITINCATTDVMAELNDLTAGRGPDSCIDAVGMEAHGYGLAYAYDRTKQALMMETDRPGVLRQAIAACRKGGTLSIPGVYGGFIDNVPIGSAFAKGLTLRMGQTHVPRYLPTLMRRIREHEIDPTFIISHRTRLEDAPEAYKVFNQDKGACTKVVMKPS
ncbi:MAG: glutathione-dependent formaldehyde dehydrogenase [Acidobacteria bacterium]|nr:glutathione-dependent formaldehyde dehydrogenase [Acidobacteriota bacterium]